MERHELQILNVPRMPNPKESNIDKAIRDTSTAIKQLWAKDTEIDNRLKRLEKYSERHWFHELEVYNNNNSLILPMRFQQDRDGDTGICMSAKDTLSYGIGIDQSESVLKISPECPLTDEYYFAMNSIGQIRVNTGVYIDDFSDDDTFADLSDTALVTERAIAAHIAAVTFWDRDAINGYIYPRTLTDYVCLGLNADITIPIFNMHINTTSWAGNSAAGILLQSLNEGALNSSPGILFATDTWATPNLPQAAIGMSGNIGSYCVGAVPGDLILRVVDTSTGIGFATYEAGVGDATIKMFMNHDGEVSIGEGQKSFAGALLALWSDNSHPSLAIIAEHATDYDPRIVFRTDNPHTPKCTLGVDSGDSDKFKIYMGGGIGGTSQFVFTSTARLGIGTNAPASPLEIWRNNANPAILISAEHATDYDPQIQFRTDDPLTIKASIGVDAATDNFIIDIGAGGVGGSTDFIFDAIGLSVDGSVSIGGAANADRLLDIQNATINTTNDYWLIRAYGTKTAGVTASGDDFHGCDLQSVLNHNGATIGHLRGVRAFAILTDGGVGDAGTARDMQGCNFAAQTNGGKVWGDIGGIRGNVDINAGSEVAGDAKAMDIVMDIDGTHGGTAYMCYLDEGSNIDYGIYQNGTSDNRFGGNILIDSDSNGLQLGADQDSEISDDGSDMIIDYDFLGAGGGRDLLLQANGTTYFTIDSNGIVPGNNATIHAIAQTGAPTSTTEGALWYDTDAGANGTLMCYANGAWRTVQAF